MEFEVERLKEIVIKKFQTTAIITQAKPIAKNGDGAKRKKAPKSNVSGNKRASPKKKNAYRSKKSNKRGKSKARCHNCEKLGYFACCLLSKIHGQ